MRGIPTGTNGDPLEETDPTGMWCVFGIWGDCGGWVPFFPPDWSQIRQYVGPGGSPQMVKVVRKARHLTSAPNADCAQGLSEGSADLVGLNRALNNWDTLKGAASANGIDPAMLAA